MSELPRLGDIREYISIPPIFHSFLNEGLFENCLICNKFLLEDGIQYIVERAFMGEEPIYEFALCMDCQVYLSNEFSEETSRRIDSLFDERVDLVSRREELLKQSITEVEPWIDQCIISGEKRSECKVYTIYGHCDGPDLLFTYFPYMISGKGMSEIAELLSQKSRERIDEFTDEFLGLPPELKSDPNTPQLVFV